MSYITVLCVQGIPILSLLIFMPSLYSTLDLLVRYIYRIRSETFARGGSTCMPRMRIVDSWVNITQYGSIIGIAVGVPALYRTFFSTFSFSQYVFW